MKQARVRSLENCLHGAVIFPGWRSNTACCQSGRWYQTAKTLTARYKGAIWDDAIRLVSTTGADGEAQDTLASL